MLDELVVLHEPASGETALPTALNSLRWETCLRRIVLLNQVEYRALLGAGRADSETYRGKDAYRFLLEVVCGLRSPLIGETEVLGQFRNFCAKAKFPPTPWGWFLSQLTADLLEDAKQVRHRRLQGLGSQSYGSLVRQHLKSVPVTAILGSGQLAREILTWVNGKTEVRLFCRNRSHGETLLKDFPQIHIRQLTDSTNGWNDQNTALVIAAPLSSKGIEKWIGLQNVNFTKALDLRGNAESDPWPAAFPLIKLPELFAALAADRQKMTPRIAAAHEEIDALTRRRTQQAQFRPFGWEDLCA